MAEESERAKPQHEIEDRISALPDPLIQHILSLLPSTKEAIQTSVLSKRWYNQWTRVPALIFSNSGMSDERFSRFIGSTLALLDSRSKIQKLHILSVNYEVGKDPHFNSKLHFAIRKGVEELVLEFKRSGSECRLPDYIFNYASLVKLQMYNCRIMTDGVVSWGRLKELSIEYSTFSAAVIENILLGSPSLELLHLSNYHGLSRLKIASKSLKKVVLQFAACCCTKLEVFCPKLEHLKLLGKFEKIEFKDSSSLSCATLDIYGFSNVKSLFEILQLFQHVKELTFGCKFIEALANLRESDGLCNLSLNNKSLTLDQPDFVRDPLGIERALSMLPGLEKLVVKDFFYMAAGYSTKYWDPNGRVLKLVPCLKSFHIVGPRKSSECEVPWTLLNI